jgi:hypothetical protein
MTGASMNGSIEFLRQDRAGKLVDGYAVNLYTRSDPHRSLAQRVTVLENGFAACGSGAKPCWVTEWAYNNANRSCPVDDSLRLRLVEDERAAYLTFAGQGRLAALIYYSWSGHYVGQRESPGTVYRCDALTDAGKLERLHAGTLRRICSKGTQNEKTKKKPSRPCENSAETDSGAAGSALESRHDAHHRS